MFTLTACPGTFSFCSDTSGRIWSPNYPQRYNNTNFNCIYQIIAPEGLHVTFSLVVNKLGYEARDRISVSTERLIELFFIDHLKLLMLYLLKVYDGASRQAGKRILRVIGRKGSKNRIPSPVCANETNAITIKFTVGETLGGKWEGEYQIGHCEQLWVLNISNCLL